MVFVIGKEEELVLEYWSAELTAKAVVVIAGVDRRFAGRCVQLYEAVYGVELAVLEILVSFPWNWLVPLITTVLN